MLQRFDPKYSIPIIIFTGVFWGRNLQTVRLGHIGVSDGGAENAGAYPRVENAGVDRSCIFHSCIFKNAGVDNAGADCRDRKYRSEKLQERQNMAVVAFRILICLFF